MQRTPQMFHEPIALVAVQVIEIVRAHGTEDVVVVLWATTTLEESHLVAFTSTRSFRSSLSEIDESGTVDAAHSTGTSVVVEKSTRGLVRNCVPPPADPQSKTAEPAMQYFLSLRTLDSSVSPLQSKMNTFVP